MRVAMMGSGGTGGYIGARLAEAGVDVSFIARGAHLQVMRTKGLAVATLWETLTFRKVNASDSAEEIGPVDVVLFAVKTYDSENAAAPWGRS